MKTITCPINGDRPISEFIYGGELRMEPPATVDDRAWADYVFNRHNLPEIKQEWWCHAPSNTWFVAQRHTQTDEIISTYLYQREAMP